MPEEDTLDEAQVEAVARAVEAGEDGIAVPGELLVEPEGPPDTRAEPPQSLYLQVLGMRVGQKIKLALRGNKDARSILVRDASKLVRRFVLQNPRITDGEVLSIARNRSADDELLRIVGDGREWMRNYQIRVAVASNPKTPLPVALKQVPSLAERDLRTLGRSKNVPEAVAAHARRLLLARTTRG